MKRIDIQVKKAIKITHHKLELGNQLLCSHKNDLLDQPNNLKMFWSVNMHYLRPMDVMSQVTYVLDDMP